MIYWYSAVILIIGFLFGFIAGVALAKKYMKCHD